MSDDRRAQILAVFEADFPEGIRILNAGAVTQEIEHGRDVTVQVDELAADEVYTEDEEILIELAEKGIFQIGEALGFLVFGFTLEHQDKLIGEGRLGKGAA